MKTKTFILPLLLTLLLLLELSAGLQILHLNIMPVKYVLLLLAAGIAVDLLIAWLLLSCPKRNLRLCRVVGYISAVLLSVGLIFANHGIAKVRETMDTVTQTTEVSAVVELYVLREDSAKTLEDAADYSIAVMANVDQENTEAALEAMEMSWGKAAQSVSYDNVIVTVDALFGKEVDAMLINSAYVDIITELEDYVDFSQRVKCIWQYDVRQVVEEKSVKTEETAKTEEPVKAEEEAENAPFIVYISGSDTRSKKLKTSRSDVNILAAVNPKTEQVLLINTPRDYYIPNPAGGGALDKLTHCGIYGIDCSVQALSDLYDEEIRYYGQINFTGFETLIDAIGGVDVYSEVAFVSPYGNHSFKQGMNHLNGEQALSFARDRYSLQTGDNARGKNQMKVIKAVIAQISAGSIITNYSEILDSLQGMFTTNIPAEKISALVKLQLSEMIDWDVKTYAVTGSGGSEKPYSLGMNAYVMYPHQETVDLAKELIDKVMAGEILTEEDLQ